MASIIENLVLVLERENTEYEQRLGLSMRKTSIIVAGKPQELEQITDEEQIIVNRVQKLEKDRQQAMDEIARVINRDVTTIRLPDVIRILERRPEAQKKLAEVYDKLKDTVHHVERVNRQNRELIENALEMVQFDLNLLQAARKAPETANYNRGAYNTGTTMDMGEGSFDAKQ